MSRLSCERMAVCVRWPWPLASSLGSPLQELGFLAEVHSVNIALPKPEGPTVM